MTAILAAIGNNTPLTPISPNQSAFSLSDLVQICTFGMIAIGIIPTIISMRPVDADQNDQTKKVDRQAQEIFDPAHIIVMAIGTALAVRG